jgi:hypothetical protein
VLRHQLSVLERKQPRPRLHVRDRLAFSDAQGSDPFRQKLAAAELNHQIEIPLYRYRTLREATATKSTTVRLPGRAGMGRE